MRQEYNYRLPSQSESKFPLHSWWNHGNGWNSILNNLLLIIQPERIFNLIKPWLKVIKISELYEGFSKLIRITNYFTDSIFDEEVNPYFYFSSV